MGRKWVISYFKNAAMIMTNLSYWRQWFYYELVSVMQEVRTMLIMIIVVIYDDEVKSILIRNEGRRSIWCDANYQRAKWSTRMKLSLFSLYSQKI